MKKITLGITCGDPAGIGPEIALKAALHPSVQERCCPILIGSLARLKITAQQLGLSSIRMHSIQHYSTVDIPQTLNIYNTIEHDEQCPIGKPSRMGGKIAQEALQDAMRLIQKDVISGIVTCPINKTAMAMAGFSNYPGHTEFFAAVSQTEQYAMFFYSENLKVALVTRHIPLQDVSTHLTDEKILSLLCLIHDNRIVLGKPDGLKIAVCGLNPHAGEQGILGKEEDLWIRPAIEKACAFGLDVSGPFPSDTLFTEYHRHAYDVIVAMYHDQGLIPFKLLAFHQGANVTLGLPFVRTSVDHGTAFDIAGKGLANPDSLIYAIHCAVRMIHRKQRDG